MAGAIDSRRSRARQLSDTKTDAGARLVPKLFQAGVHPPLGMRLIANGAALRLAPTLLAAHFFSRMCCMLRTRLFLAALLAVSLSSVARANETDQFSLP